MATSNKKRGGAPVNIALEASKQKEFNQKITKIKKKDYVEGERIPGVVYISRLPWGFEEVPLREYFKQFGKIKMLKLSRSKKTGNSKGYAYMQFASDEVAKIVAETMNNYLMFEKLVKCKYIEKPHPATFKNAKRKFLTPVAQERAIQIYNQEKTAKTLYVNKKKAVTKYMKKMAILADAGIKLDVLDIAKDRKRKASDTEEWTDISQAKSPKLSTKKSTDATSRLKDKKTPKTPKRKSLLWGTVDTPTGKMNVLQEDSSEDEITFRTPPLTIKSSKLDTTLTEMAATPKAGLDKKTPKSAAMARKTPSNEANIGKTPKSALKKGMTPKGLAKMDQTPKSNDNGATPLKLEMKSSKTPKSKVDKTPKSDVAVDKIPKSSGKGNVDKTPKTETKVPKTPKSGFKSGKSSTSESTAVETPIKEAKVGKTPKSVQKVIKTPAKALPPNKTPKSAPGKEGLRTTRSQSKRKSLG